MRHFPVTVMVALFSFAVSEAKASTDTGSFNVQVAIAVRHVCSTGSRKEFAKLTIFAS